MATKKVSYRESRPPILTAFEACDLGESLRPREEVAALKAEERAAWLAAYRRGGWREAEASTGVAADTVHDWLVSSPAFREAFHACREAVADRLERIADGIASGEATATPAQVTMLQFRLRGLRPEVYRERASIQVDQRTTLAVDGDGSRARLLLAEWQGGAAAPQAAVRRVVARVAERLAAQGDGDGDGTEGAAEEGNAGDAGAV